MDAYSERVNEKLETFTVFHFVREETSLLLLNMWH
jgi:hypothetical protein